MKRILKFFSQSLETNISVGKYNAIVAGWLSFIGHPFYWVLWSYVFPHYHESAFFRFSSSALGLGLILNKFWPNSLQKYLPLYWFFFLMWILPVTFTYIGLLNGFTDVWIVCEIMTIFFIALLSYHWALALSSLTFGSLIGFAAFFISNNWSGMVIEQRNIEAFLTTLFVIIAGILFAHFGRLGVSGYLKESQNREKELLTRLQEERSRLLKSLAGSIAHEIRNPLNNIGLIRNEIASLIKSNTGNLSPILVKELTTLNTHATDAINNANNVINMILADLSEKPIQPSEFAYLKSETVLPQIIEKYGYRSQIERKKVRLDPSPSSTSSFIFKAIPTRFEFIVFNLLKNALYYTDQYPKSLVTLGAETREIDGKPYNAIFVYDEGPGVPKEIIPKLFDDFFTSGKKGGTGLGLSFCRRNMQIFDGDIICESYQANNLTISSPSEEEISTKQDSNQNSTYKPKLGSGEADAVNDSNPNNHSWTKFSLIFPTLLEDELKQAQEIISASTDSNSKTDHLKPVITKKILIVDDERTNLLVNKSKLETLLKGIACDTALGGLKGFEMFEESYNVNSPYDLILMDIQMPDIDGAAITKKIQDFIADKLHKNTNKEGVKEFDLPIIAFTSLDFKTFSDHAKEAKASFCDYINKSSSNNIFCRTVAKWLFGYEDKFDYLNEEIKANDLSTTLQNKEVLLVDDQEINRKIFKRILERSGLVVREATNGQEMVDSYKASLIDSNNQLISQTKVSKFNLILSDINMPILRGDEATSKIREIESEHFTRRQNRIPIIALSGDSNEHDIYRFYAAQMTDYFIKGGNVDLLIKIIFNYLKDDEAKKEAACEDYIAKNSSKTIEAAQDKPIQTKLEEAEVGSNLTAKNEELLKHESQDSVNLQIFNRSKIRFFPIEEQRELANLYLNDSNNRLTEIRQAFSKSDYAQASFSIHALKGISANMGGEKLVDFIRNIEPYLQHNQSPPIENWPLLLDNFYDELKLELKKL